MEPKAPPVRDDQFYRSLLDEIHDGVYFVDAERTIVYWNKAAERTTGYGEREVVGRHCSESGLSHVDERGINLCRAGCPLAATLLDGRNRGSDLFVHHKNGHRLPINIRVSPVYGDGGEIIGAVEIFSDASEWRAMKDRMAQLEKTVYLDPLTGLPNRRYLEDQLKVRLEEMRRYGWPLGLVFMDLDNFKQINDRHGHEAGDRTLALVGRTLSATSRALDLVGRWGGDEFVALIRNVTRESLVQVAERYRAMVKQSFLLEGDLPVSVTLSTGAVLAGAQDDAAGLLSRADRLLYCGKNAGRDCVFVQEP